MTERTRKALDLVIKARRNLSNSTEEEALDFILNCVYAIERLPLEKQSLFALFGLVREGCKTEDDKRVFTNAGTLRPKVEPLGGAD